MSYRNTLMGKGTTFLAEQWGNDTFIHHVPGESTVNSMFQIDRLSRYKISASVNT